MNCDYYHPQWDHHQDLSKADYAKTLQALSSAQADAPLIVTDNAVAVTTKGQRLWNKVKGFFGFEDRTAIVRVNYELLKFLRYGERFHYNDDTIKSLLQTLQNHSSIDSTVKQCLQSLKELDVHIRQYHSDNEKELRPSFWSRVRAAPSQISQKTDSIFKFSMSRIHANNGKWAEAIEQLRVCVKAKSPADAPIHLARALVEVYTTKRDVALLNEGLQSLEQLPSELKNFQETQELISGINEKLAEFYCGKGEFDKALKAYEEVKNKVLKPWVRKLCIGLIAEAAKAQNSGKMQASLTAMQEHGFRLTADELEPVLAALYKAGQYEKVADLAETYGDDKAVVELAKRNYDDGKFKAAVCLYEKARAYPQADSRSLLVNLSDCYRNLGRLDEAQKVLDAPGAKSDERYIEERGKLAIDQGTKVGAQIASNPQNVKKKIADFVTRVKSSEVYPSIVKALGMFKGESSSQNRAFLQLGKNGEGFDAVLEDGQKAIELITTAFDGSWGHNKPDGMPKDISQEVSQLKKIVDDMVQYHAESKKDIQELAARAIEYNLEAYNANPSKYAEHVNRLVDAYFLKGDYAMAIKTFEELKEKFSSYPVEINVEAYSREAERLLSLKQFQSCIGMLTKAIELYPENLELRQKLSHAYFDVGQTFAQKGNVEAALGYYNKALDCGVDAEAACYAALADIYQKPYEAEGKHSDEEFNKIVGLRKKATEKAPLNAEYAFQHGRLIYFYDLEHKNDCLTSLQKAVELEPNNTTYLYGLLAEVRRKKLPEEEITRVFRQFKENGGDIANNYWEPQSY